ncbi:UPF0287-domain-containing protein [Diaporthe amygdali]|uniref:UPF0287-domain-containing protein n=1 Tax=Phomopsis amygdali TaxID=1214568 RepID=UPI0022FE0B4D|nr:UPF0287-domain-containing protein [Diaporthe amygdali]KAJ0121390.1 UPF0287-domain-containing protein [Diaporthe amygdali]
MHPHLHTKDNTACEDLMTALEECHERGFLWKSMGMCNSAKESLSACLRAERRKRQDTNRNKSQEKRDAIRQKWKEIDENS